ncbi:hypothetical protein FDY93_14025 [Microbulbifer harenosus]|uniref:Uncharacterized protein n=1 Tax=Microbulbifer harenosus TaxID=2576840 RepID=A0ABY2UFC0_9GAMM|nr:hypothetical protein FDY93_14025 [Microbulbifer harenosus]
MRVTFKDNRATDFGGVIL